MIKSDQLYQSPTHQVSIHVHTKWSNSTQSHPTLFWTISFQVRNRWTGWVKKGFGWQQHVHATIFHLTSSHTHTIKVDSTLAQFKTMQFENPIVAIQQCKEKDDGRHTQRPSSPFSQHQELTSLVWTIYHLLNHMLARRKEEGKKMDLSVCMVTSKMRHVRHKSTTRYDGLDNADYDQKHRELVHDVAVLACAIPSCTVIGNFCHLWHVHRMLWGWAWWIVGSGSEQEDVIQFFLHEVIWANARLQSSNELLSRR